MRLRQGGVPPNVTLVAHAGSYGGVATHLNHFVSVLRELCTIKGVFFFTVDSVSVDPIDGIPTPVLKPNIPRWIAGSIIFRALRVPLTFFREILLSFRHPRELLGKHIVLTSHDPNALWGFVLLSRQAEYSLFVLPDIDTEQTNGKSVAIRLWNGLLRRMILKRISNGALRLAVPTREAAEIWSRFIGIDPVLIQAIPHPPFLARNCANVIPDTQKADPIVDDLIRRAEEGERIVLSVGHLEDYKNPQKWLEFAKFVHQKEPKILFVWVGGGSRFEEMQASVWRHKRIILAGRLNQQDLRRLYKASWLFFHPAIKESQGIVVMDALTLGLPVILNKSEALPGLIADTEAGYVIDCNETDAKAAFLRILQRFQDDKEYEKASREAATLAKSRFSYETWRSDLARLIHGT
jgi:glycosyltransferase involved in cell wall biosynthesis